jgi:uncharacterized protein YjiS (DUF1127 family)
MTSAQVGTSYATLAGRAIGGRTGHGAGVRVAEVLLTWIERTRQRRELGRLSDHMLKDIGLNRSDVEAEVTKPFWRA